MATHQGHPTSGANGLRVAGDPCGGQEAALDSSVGLLFVVHRARFVTAKRPAARNPGQWHRRG